MNWVQAKGYKLQATGYKKQALNGQQITSIHIANKLQGFNQQTNYEIRKKQYISYKLQVIGDKNLDVIK